MASENGDSRFHFTYIPKKKLNVLEDKTVKPLLKKWGLNGRLQSQTFAYNGAVEDFEIKKLLEEFFQSSDVYPYLKTDPVCSFSEPLTKLTLHKVPCTLTDLQLFERLCDPKNGIVFPSTNENLTRNGVELGKLRLRECLQKEIDGFLVADELRKFLLDSEERPLYTKAEKDEFLFCLFKHICLGGLWSQYEDCLDPYLLVTKMLYKSLISVVKGGSSSHLVVRSRVFKVEARAESGDVATFPREPERENNFAYVIVDVDKKYVTTWVHQAGWCEQK